MADNSMYNFSVDSKVPLSKQICPYGGYVEELVSQDCLLIWVALFDLNLWTSDSLVVDTAVYLQSHCSLPSSKY